MSALAGHDSAEIGLLWLVASLVGVAALVVLVIVYRRAAGRHAIEEAERVIAEHDTPDE